MSWSDLEAAGGFGMKEYWSKLSVDGGGMHLSVTRSVEDILGFTPDELSKLPLSILFSIRVDTELIRHADGSRYFVATAGSNRS